jgi:hypothetical protein
MVIETTKEIVIKESYLDGVLQSTTVLKNRTVYHLKNGTYEVNYLGGHRTVEKDGHGRFVWKLYVKTGTAMSGTQFVEMLKKRQEETGLPVVIFTATDSDWGK